MYCTINILFASPCPCPFPCPYPCPCHPCAFQHAVRSRTPHATCPQAAMNKIEHRRQCMSGETPREVMGGGGRGGGQRRSWDAQRCRQGNAIPQSAYIQQGVCFLGNGSKVRHQQGVVPLPQVLALEPGHLHCREPVANPRDLPQQLVVFRNRA